MDYVARVSDAYRKIAPFIRKTPLEYSPYFSERTGADVFLKLENYQLTGSFKVRGAMHKLMCLSDAERASGVVTASSGNHGAAVACGLARLGIDGEIFLPENVSPTKEANIRGHLRGTRGVIRHHGTDSGATEVFARRYAEENHRCYVSPYNDEAIVAGQGTVGLEIEAQLRELDGRTADAVLVAVGGGGLIAGTAGYLAASARSLPRSLHVVASSPRNSAAMEASLRAGHVVSFPSTDTLSDGTAGDVEVGCITFPLLKDLVDEFVLVAEEDIAEAMRAMVAEHRMIVEGAAGVALASLDAVAGRLVGKTVVVVLCGANVAVEKLRSILR